MKTSTKITTIVIIFFLIIATVIIGRTMIGNHFKKKFESFKFDQEKNIVFSCGSGVTASVLALAYSLINAKYMPTIYDGSWSEYGKN